MTTLTRRGTTPNHDLGTKMVHPKMPRRVWVVGHLPARELGCGRTHAERSERSARAISLFFTAILMTLARFVGIYMSRRAFCRLTFSGNQDDLYFFLKLRNRHARQPSLFFTADLMALARFV